MFIALAGLWRAGALISAARAVFARAAQFVIYATRAEKRRRDNNARINPILFVARDDRCFARERDKNTPRTVVAADDL